MYSSLNVMFLQMVLVSIANWSFILSNLQSIGNPPFSAYFPRISHSLIANISRTLITVAVFWRYSLLISYNSHWTFVYVVNIQFIDEVSHSFLIGSPSDHFRILLYLRIILKMFMPTERKHNLFDILRRVYFFSKLQLMF